MSSALKTNEKLTEILTSAEADGDITAAYNTALSLRSLLLARLYTTKFLNTSNPEASQRVRDEFALIRQYYTVLDEELQNQNRRRLLNEAMALTNSYESTFGTVEKLIIERDSDVHDSLNVMGPEIAKDLDDVKLSVMNDQDILGPRLQAQNARTIVVVISLSILALVLGIGAAVITISGILKQLGADPAVIQSIMENVALGKLDMDFDTRKAPVGVYASVIQMLDAMKEKVGAVESMAARDLTVDVRVASDEDVLGKSLVTMKRNLNELLSQATVATEQVNIGSSQIAQSSQELSQGGRRAGRQRRADQRFGNRGKQSVRRECKELRTSHGNRRQCFRKGQRGQHLYGTAGCIDGAYQFIQRRNQQNCQSHR